LSPDLPARYLALPCSVLPVACRALSCRKLSRFKIVPIVCYPPLARLPPNSNFLHPRSQFHSRLLSLSLLTDLSLFVPGPSLSLGKCGGRPCVRGYRLRVKDVLELLAHGASWDEILEDYSFLEREDIQACLDFAAAQSDHALIKVS
jgi:uncharacterized protein (DUF433 family)